MSNYLERFKATYNHEPQDIAFTPYRICTLGAHIDHQYGPINGFAINYGIHFAYSEKQNGVVELQSINFDKRAQFHINSVPEEKQGDWADHLRGVTKVLGDKFPLKKGICGVFEGDIPIGGLSSSAAVIITFMTALCKINGIELTNDEIIRLAQKAENEYVGVSCGTLDQSCEVLCKENKLLYLDTKDGSYRTIGFGEDSQAESINDFAFMVIFSGVERALANSKYNMRQDECKAAAYALKAYADMEYGKFIETRLREVPYEVYKEHKEKLPENWRKRAEHFYTEYKRVEAGTKAWAKGDIGEYARLVSESGASSIYNYESGSPELKRLYEIMMETDGVMGGRFSGAGFKGCCLAIIEPSKFADIEKSIREKYLASFPELTGKIGFYLCKTVDGVGN